MQLPPQASDLWARDRSNRQEQNMEATQLNSEGVNCGGKEPNSAPEEGKEMTTNAIEEVFKEQLG